MAFSIDGINSGLDTQKIIDSIMAVERLPAVLLERQQAEKTNIISAFKAFEAKLLALNTAVGKLSLAKTFNASSVDISDDTYINATATGKVGAGSYDMQVLSLARNHQLASQGFDDREATSFGTGTISLYVGDGSEQTITIDSSNNTLDGIAKAINDAEAGVTASIISDGSSANSHRLILSAKETGVANQISFTSNLTGGDNLNFSTASFDVPEMLSTDPGTTAQVALGSTASFTGDENKIYTFTVDGGGTQTVGTDNITLNWTDGTNSGSIVVTQADTEIELVGEGSEGLKLSFSAGEFHGGDTFQVGSFSPLLQEASDAKLAVGSAGGGGSPITVTSETNQFKDVVPGVSLVLRKETEPGDSISITTSTDTSAIKSSIQSVITAYNDVMDFIDKQNTYNQDTTESGILFGDRTVQIMQSSIQNAFGDRIEGIDSKYNQMYSVGIRTGVNGQLAIKNSSRLEEALTEDLDAVVRLFTSTGTSSNNYIEFVSAGNDTREGEQYEVDITRAATKGRFQGVGTTDPGTTPLTLTSANNKLGFSVDGIQSENIVLSARTYNSAEELIKELQQKIDADDKIGGKGLEVEWIETGAGVGYINLTSSSYGEGSKINIITSVPDSALVTLGLATGTSHIGTNVEGTINGESATGLGQVLTGDEDNATTAGLKLSVSLTSSQLGDGAEGTVGVTKGVAARLDDLLDSYTAAGDGLIARRVRGYQNQVEYLSKRVEEIDIRLEKRRYSLTEKWLRMEETLGMLQNNGNWLSSQLATLDSNWQI